MARSLFRLLLFSVALALVAAPAADAASGNRWIKKRPLNIAHQGGEDEFPSNTMYAFKKAVRAGADMLELDIGVTKDNQVVVIHDTTVDGKTNGTGTIASKTLRQIKRLDAAYWFSKLGPNHYDHNRPARAYKFRGIATKRRRPPRGFKASDFRIPTLKEVLRAFPHTPINIEIKGRTPAEADAEYILNAEILASKLKRVKRRDLIVVSFKQKAVERFHQLVPRIDVAPGTEGVVTWFGGGSPGAGVKAFQVPITFELSGVLIPVTTKSNVARAHREGYAWQNWFGGADSDSADTWRTLVDTCVDGIMTSHPTALEKVLRVKRPPADCATP